jgi:hypothetical protein
MHRCNTTNICPHGVTKLSFQLGHGCIICHPRDTPLNGPQRVLNEFPSESALLVNIANNVDRAKLEIEPNALFRQCNSRANNHSSIAEERHSAEIDSTVSAMLKEPLDIGFILRVYNGKRHRDVVTIAIAAN